MKKGASHKAKSGVANLGQGTTLAGGSRLVGRAVWLSLQSIRWARLARREPQAMAVALGKARNAARRAQRWTRSASASGAMPALTRRGHS